MYKIPLARPKLYVAVTLSNTRVNSISVIVPTTPVSKIKIANALSKCSCKVVIEKKCFKQLVSLFGFVGKLWFKRRQKKRNELIKIILTIITDYICSQRRFEYLPLFMFASILDRKSWSASSMEINKAWSAAIIESNVFESNVSLPWKCESMTECSRV